MDYQNKILPGLPADALRGSESLPSGLRLASASMQHTDIATHDGKVFDQVQEYLVDIAEPLYVLYELPIDADVDVELITRFYQANNGAANLLILWDYDVSNATKTPLQFFNANNKYRLTNLAQFEVSVLNPITINAVTGVATVTGSYVPIDAGIIREQSSITATGVGSNQSGGIGMDSGSRIYGRGTGYLVKITSAANDNKITLGYSTIEDVD